MNDALVNAIRPVIPQNLDIVCALERGPSGLNRFLPAQTLPENEGGHAAILAGELEGEGLVAAQLRRLSVELLELICPDDVDDILPGQDVEICVRGANDALVLGAEVEQEGRTFCGQLVRGTIDLPEGKRVEGAHGRGDREGDAGTAEDIYWWLQVDGLDECVCECVPVFVARDVAELVVQASRTSGNV